MATWWRVPRDYAGQTCVILATGASLTQKDVDYAAARAPVIAISDAWRLCPQAFCLYSCDAKWWRYHQNVPQYKGLKVTLDDSLAFPDVLCLKWRREEGWSGFDDDPEYLRTGKNSGYQALHLAAHFGFSRIILLGYDMRGEHFFGKHPKELDVDTPFSEFIDAFKTIVEPLKERGVEVINCTPGSALPWFEKKHLKEVLCAPAA